jgi:hypothetical protein
VRGSPTMAVCVPLVVGKCGIALKNKGESQNMLEDQQNMN